MKQTLLATLAVAFFLFGCQPAQLKLERQIEQSVDNHNDMAYAALEDAMVQASRMNSVIRLFVSEPSVAHMVAARQAWLNAREPFLQAEMYLHLAEKQGWLSATADAALFAANARIAAWPVAEAMLDYARNDIDGNAQPQQASNAITGNLVINVGRYQELNPELLAVLFKTGNDPRNISAGFHAIEFLLWGQDVNADLSVSRPRDGSPGQRPLSDYFQTPEQGSCTFGEETVPHSFCQRRGDLLVAAADLLLDDLTLVSAAWIPGEGDIARAMTRNPGSSMQALLATMAEFSQQVLAQQRIRKPMLIGDQELEPSDFSDNSHRDLMAGVMALQNSFEGTYKRIDGEQVSGASLRQILHATGQDGQAELLATQLQNALYSAVMIDSLVKSGNPFDRLIELESPEPNLVSLANSLESFSATLAQLQLSPAQ